MSEFATFAAVRTLFSFQSVLAGQLGSAGSSAVAPEESSTTRAKSHIDVGNAKKRLNITLGRQGLDVRRARSDIIIFIEARAFYV
jgi:hypothetical protein